MDVWVLMDDSGSVIRLGYKDGSYTHASVFYTEHELLEAAEYFGGKFKYKKMRLEDNK